MLNSGSYLFTDDRCTRRGDKNRTGLQKNVTQVRPKTLKNPVRGPIYFCLSLPTGRRGRSLRPRSRVVSKGNGQGGCVVADRKGIGADDLRTTEV